MYFSDCRVRLIHCLAQEAECSNKAGMILQIPVFKPENVSTEVFNVHVLQVVTVHSRLCRLSVARVKMQFSVHNSAE